LFVPPANLGANLPTTLGLEIIFFTF